MIVIEFSAINVGSGFAGVVFETVDGNFGGLPSGFDNFLRAIKLVGAIGIACNVDDYIGLVLF
jgi:hypothetical protein